MRRDPGIPNSCPFKADIIANLMRRKQEREEQSRREREEKFRQQQQQQQQQQEEQARTAAESLQSDGSSGTKAMRDIVYRAEAAMMAFEAAAAAGPSGSSCRCSNNQRNPGKTHKKPRFMVWGAGRRVCGCLYRS